MIVLDTSGAVDYLLATGESSQVEQLLEQEGPVAAPDLIVFEVMAVLRRKVFQAEIGHGRAEAALRDLGDMPLLLFPTLDLRLPAWRLRDNFTAADALFAVLAAELECPLVTKDGPLVEALATFTDVTSIHLRS